MRLIPWIISWSIDIYRILRPAGGELLSLDGDELDAFMREMYPSTMWEGDTRGTTLNLQVGAGADDEGSAS